jgi:uncharacterized protein DUF664
VEAGLGWFAPGPSKGEGTYDRGMDDETLALLQSLSDQRDHVLGILDGLSEEQLHRPVLPSGWNCVGLVQHLALDVEHYWFRCIMAGESLDFFSPQTDHPKGGWKVDPGESSAELLTVYRDEIARSNAIIETIPLNSGLAQRDAWWGEWSPPDFRCVMLHVITETACHAGHLDATRELLDGHQRLVL